MARAHGAEIAPRPKAGAGAAVKPMKRGGAANGAATKPIKRGGAANGAAAKKLKPAKRAPSADLDENLESADEDEEQPARARGKTAGQMGNSSDEGGGSSDEEDAETADERRVRLARTMLAKLEAAKRTKAADDSDADSDALDADINRELQKQAAVAAGRHFERIAARLKEAPAAEPSQPVRAHRRSPTCLVLSADESTAFTSSKDGDLVKWDLETGKRTRLTPKGARCQPVAAMALSGDGHLLATGGPDKLLHIWDTRTGKCVESFKGHRDGLTALAFGGRKNELFTAASDRTVKIWNLDEMTYVETLFGHADAITSIDSLNPERAISAGVDRTVRMWKVLEETQLVFNGHKASIDCVRMLTHNSFLTGSQDGSLCLWIATRKKPVATVRNAHGPGSNAGAPCNWISAIGALPGTDLAATGAADGHVRFWRCDAERNSLEQVYSIPVPGFVNGIEIAQTLRRFAVVATAQEHRLGRWFVDPSGKNGLAIVPLPPGLAS
ncbi:WD40-repeat-containing domain protein [Pavlovales sp. CCMP2436]|nr:WD40-repeat-containing domain protein [Pavlovales sp. CCMP2436]|mmetsp:Transcript_43254/g.107366  ORF Transcript_43254/g.107366 Transcript_43254/m.107366 type:complete len:499 (-) Transcript_43254:204-1700(-)